MNYKKILNFSRYLVGEDGHVYLKANFTPMKEQMTNAGYLRVTLVNDSGEAKTINVHRLVAQEFCPNEEELPEVNHINGIKTDNRADNLEWVSRADNLKHAYESGLMPNDASPKKVTATNMETGEQMEFPSIYKAARFFGISQGNICMCCKGLRPYANGYYWDYLEEEGSSENA